jgi:hypothetical protein
MNINYTSKSPIYNVWCGMKSRCYNKNRKSYPRYGGRGISVCKEWIHNFKTFAVDMGERPNGYTLERIDNNKGYSKDNCKWASRSEQQLNREITGKFLVDGVIVIPCVVARENGMKGETILKRIKKGLPLNEVLSKERTIKTEHLIGGGKANGIRQKSKTHCPKGHEYTEDNLLKSKLGFRKCKTCHRLYARSLKNK